VNRILRRKLWRELFRHKGSLLWLVIIVAIGVGTFFGMRSVYRDLDNSRAEFYSKYRLSDFTIDLKKVPDWVLGDLVKTVNVVSLRGRISYGVLIDLPNQEMPITGSALSMPPDRRPVENDLLLKQGTWFSSDGADEVILNDNFARANKLKPGDRIKVTLLDKQHHVLVVGTAISPEFVYLLPTGGGLAPDPARFGVMYFTDGFLRESCDLEGAWNQIIGKVSDGNPSALTQTLDTLEERLDSYGVTLTTPGYDQPSVQFLRDELKGIQISAVVGPTIFLGVAAMILNIVLGRMISRDRTTIGTLKALGYTNTQLAVHYLSFGILVGIIGGLVGLLLGRWIEVSLIVNIYSKLYALPEISPRLYWDLPLIALIISLVAACLGSLQGVRATLKLSPAQAMRPPSPEKGSRIILEKLPWFWRRLPFRTKLVLRNIFRNKFRSFASIMATFIAASLVQMTLNNLQSLTYLIEYQFEQMSHEDVTITLRDPEDGASRGEIQSLGGIAYSEPQLQVPCDFTSARQQKRTAITGLTPGGKLFTPLDRFGKPVPIPERGLILTKKLSEILEVGVGDVIRVRPLIAERRESRVLIVGVVDTYMGLGAYANIAFLSGLLGEESATNSVTARLFTEEPGAAFFDEVKDRPTVIGIGERTRALDQIEKTFGEAMGGMLATMILFAGMIAFGSVLNTALVSLNERQRDVGTLRVLGYTSRQVSAIFSGESLILNTIGIVMGIGGGIGLTVIVSKAYNTELFRFPIVIDIPSIFYTVLIMTFFVLAAQMIIFFLIKRLPWLDVLKVKE
jgi:putative ABC transport system permease protein